MTTSLLTFPLLVVGVALLVCGVPGSRADDDEEMSNKEITERLAIVTAEVKSLKSDVQSLKNEKSSTVQSTDKDEAFPQILNVSRQLLPDGTARFAVRYQLPKNMRAFPFWRDTYDFRPLDEIISNKIQRLPPHVYESRIITKARNDSSGGVTFELGHMGNWMILWLRNDVIEDGVGIEESVTVENPVLDIQPKGDLVYEPGHNVTVRLTVPPKNERGDPGSYIPDNNLQLNMAVLESGQSKSLKQYYINTPSDDDEGLLAETNVVKYFDKEERELEINTAGKSMMGLVTFQIGENTPTGIIQRFGLGRAVVLRPSTQSGPFPEGEIYEAPLPWKERDEAGVYDETCSDGKACEGFCSFLANNVTDIQLWRAEGDGAQSRTWFKKTVSGSRDAPYQVFGLFDVTPATGMTKANSVPVLYRCVATNAQGKTATTSLRFHFGVPAEILKEQSSLELHENKTADVTCTAQGTPRPNVTISCGYEGKGTQQRVVYQTDDVSSVTTTCPDVSEWSWISCDADNKIGMDNHHFDFSQLEQSSHF